MWRLQKAHYPLIHVLEDMFCPDMFSQENNLSYCTIITLCIGTGWPEQYFKHRRGTRLIYCEEKRKISNILLQTLVYPELWLTQIHLCHKVRGSSDLSSKRWFSSAYWRSLIRILTRRILDSQGCKSSPWRLWSDLAVAQFDLSLH